MLSWVSGVSVGVLIARGWSTSWRQSGIDSWTSWTGVSVSWTV